MKKHLSKILIVLLVAWIAWSNILNPPEPEVETVTKIEYDTVEVEIKGDPVIKWKEKIVADEEKVNELNSLVDSLQAEMNALIDSTGQIGEYTAKQDTVIKDSVGVEVAQISITAHSRIPFDPELYMLSRITLFNKHTTTTTTITGGKTFWQRFGISAQTGIGMGLITKQVDIYVGVGFHFEIN